MNADRRYDLPLSQKLPDESGTFDTAAEQD
jgi:hypothetical protein